MHHRRRPGAEFGGRKKISPTKFSNDPFLGKYFHFHAENLWWLFLVINWLSFLSFPLSQLSNIISYIIYNIYIDRSFLDENVYFTDKNFRSYFRTLPITLLLEILWGRMHGPFPTSNFGGPFPQSLLGLRPWHASTWDWSPFPFLVDVHMPSTWNTHHSLEIASIMTVQA